MEDILLDTDFDLLMEGGDLVIGPSTEQHQALLLLCNKGDFRESPMVGVGVTEYLKDENEAALLGEIKAQFEKDGMNVRSVAMLAGELKIDATYP